MTTPVPLTPPLPTLEPVKPALLAGQFKATRKSRPTQATGTCFIGGLAAETTSEEVIAAAKEHGVTMIKCHILPAN